MVNQELEVPVGGSMVVATICVLVKQEELYTVLIKLLRFECVVDRGMNCLLVVV